MQRLFSHKPEHVRSMTHFNIYMPFIFIGCRRVPRISKTLLWRRLPLPRQRRSLYFSGWRAFCLYEGKQGWCTDLTRCFFLMELSGKATIILRILQYNDSPYQKLMMPLVILKFRNRSIRIHVLPSRKSLCNQSIILDGLRSQKERSTLRLPNIYARETSSRTTTG